MHPFFFIQTYEHLFICLILLYQYFLFFSTTFLCYNTFISYVILVGEKDDGKERDSS